MSEVTLTANKHSQYNSAVLYVKLGVESKGLKGKKTNQIVTETVSNRGVGDSVASFGQFDQSRAAVEEARYELKGWWKRQSIDRQPMGSLRQKYRRSIRLVGRKRDSAADYYRANFVAKSRELIRSVGAVLWQWTMDGY